MLAFLPGTPCYYYVPPREIRNFVEAYFMIGIWCLFYLLWRAEGRDAY